MLLMLFLLFFFFFFSSRRRHTRLQGDWSSDVCSSDLCAGALFFVHERNSLKVAKGDYSSVRDGAKVRRNQSRVKTASHQPLTPCGARSHHSAAAAPLSLSTTPPFVFPLAEVVP